jgi:predicted amidohydrolase
MSDQNTFTAAMVQMRTGLLPEPSLEQGIRLIREAAAQGADYVLTPEVSNMMQLNRKALFEHLASEEDDKSLQAYRALAESGASFLTVPSAFTRKTGEAHWHTLLRARAIETGCFVFAAAQAGLHENKRETFGHSLIVDPWGEIIAEGGVEPGVFLAKIDPAKVETARKAIPSLQHGRRFGIADLKAGPEHLHLVRGSA